MAPKVFLSHASEDKDRFVLEFAERLRAKGIDVWLDKWEMLPGDSLIDKIFEEGLKNAQAVIIVLSSNSVNKKWVKEELNAGMVKTINEGSKLIPVIIDSCEVPECLKSTVWQTIKDIGNYEDELDRIVMAIFGHVSKPPLGHPPKYTHTVVDVLPGLNEVDSIIIKIACQKAVEKGDLGISIKDIYEELNKLEIQDEVINETLDVLDRNGYIKATRVMGGRIPLFFITNYGFDNYVRLNIDGYDDIVKAVIYNIVNREMKNNHLIAENLKKPRIIVDHILSQLESRGLLKIAKSSGRNIHIFNISPELKRIFT